MTFFETTARRQAADRGLYQALAGQGSADDKSRIWPHIVDAVTTLFTRAQQAGVMRTDAQPQDVAFIFAMLGVIFDTGVPNLWHRYLTLCLDGLSATARPTLPITAPTLPTLDDMIAVSKRY